MGHYLTKQAVGKGAERPVPESSLLEPSVAPAEFVAHVGKGKAATANFTGLGIQE
jgi:hypothetical protein